jgi:hypothetical protein
MISDCNTFMFLINLENGCTWLLLFLFFFLFGTIITGRVMQGIASSIVRKSEIDINYCNSVKTRMPLIGFTMKYDSEKLKDKFLGVMPTGSIALLRQWLRFDFLFMAFLYPFMLFVAWWLFRCSLICSLYSSCSSMHFCEFIPLIIWLFDILENFFALCSIENTSKINVAFMRIFSTSKWIVAIFYTAPVLCMLIADFYVWTQELL